jgi:hypothetical protein
MGYMKSHCLERYYDLYRSNNRTFVIADCPAPLGMGPYHGTFHSRLVRVTIFG